MAIKQKTRDKYYHMVDKVITYIHKNLDKDLSLEHLAKVACFAPYHFHRIFQSIQGESLKKSIRRIKMQRAAWDLIHTNMEIKKISKRAGYENLNSFKRKFTDNFRMSPDAYREKGKLTIYNIDHPKKEDNGMYAVEIIDVEDIVIASTNHVGDYINKVEVYDRLITFMNYHDLFKSDTRSFAIFYDDPNSCDARELRSKAGFTVSPDFKDNGEVKKHIIPGGKYAYIVHKGPYAELENTYKWLYGNWLVNSGFEVGEHPPIEEYLNDPRETPPSELLTGIYISLKK